MLRHLSTSWTVNMMAQRFQLSNAKLLLHQRTLLAIRLALHSRLASSMMASTGRTCSVIAAHTLNGASNAKGTRSKRVATTHHK